MISRETEIINRNNARISTVILNNPMSAVVTKDMKIVAIRKYIETALATGKNITALYQP